MKKAAFERITIVIINPPSTEKNDDPSGSSLREFANCDRFANELQAHTSATVTIVEYYPQVVLPTEFILLYTGTPRKADSEFLNKFRKRTIFMDISTGYFEELHKYGFAGVVGGRLYIYWQMNQPVFVVPCFLGLTVVAKEMKAYIWREIGEYCDMTDDVTFPMLPVFLLHYLETYSKIMI